MASPQSRGRAKQRKRLTWLANEWGASLERARLDRGWSQKGCAWRAGVAYNTVRNIEAAASLPYRHTRAKLAKALGIPMADLFPEPPDT